MKRSRTIAIGIGSLLLLSAIVTWFASPVLAQRFTTPVDCSFPMQRGQRVSVQFAPKLAGPHYIGISLERNLPFARLQQIVGPFKGEPASRPDIELEITSGDQMVATRAVGSTWWGTSVGFDLVSFDAERGRTYTVTAKVREAQPDLSALNSHLIVTVPPLTGARFYFRAAFARALSVVAAVVGAVVALTLLWRHVRAERPNQSMEPTASRRYN